MKREAESALPTLSRRRFGVIAGSTVAASLLTAGARSASAQRVEAATRLGSGVAARPEDRYVLPWRSPAVQLIFVITESGDVWVHQVFVATGVSAPWRVGAIERIGDNVRWVALSQWQGGIYVVRWTGDTMFYPLSVSLDASANARVRLTAGQYVVGPTGDPSDVLLVARNREDQRMLVLRDRAIVFRSDGATGVHRTFSGTRWSAGGFTAADSYRPVANQPQDKWLVPLCGERIGVITDRGELFVHGYDFTRDAVLPPTRVDAPPIAANPQDRFVASDGLSIFVVTRSGDLYAHRIGC